MPRDLRWYHRFLPEYEVLRRLDAIERKLDLSLNIERRTENTMALDFSQLIAAANAQTTVTAGVLATLTELRAHAADLSAQLAAAIAANDPVAQAAVQQQLNDLATGIQSNDNALATAIATTPDAPANPAPTN